MYFTYHPLPPQTATPSRHSIQFVNYLGVTSSIPYRFVYKSKYHVLRGARHKWDGHMLLCAIMNPGHVSYVKVIIRN